MSWKERLVRSLPYLLFLVSATGVVVTEEIYYAIASLVGMWLLPSPLTQPNVSRETSITDKLHFVCAECLTERDPMNVSRETFGEVNVSRETSSDDVEFYRRTLAQASELPVPCPVMHGSADDHVLGCEGWTFPR